MEIKKNCPYCQLHGKTPDVGRHMYVNLKKNVFYCQRCNHSGVWNAGIICTEDFVKEDRYKNTELFSFNIKGTNPTANKVYDYIVNRLPADVVIEKVRWSPDITRAFFPVWSEGEVCMWQGRSINDSLKPKYLTWGSCSNYLYNFENVDDWAVLCEGPIDALSTPHGIALFGKHISEIQFSMIVSKYDKIYWALDEDTSNDEKLKEAREVMDKFIEVVELPMKGDPNSTGYEGMEKLIQEAT